MAKPSDPLSFDVGLLRHRVAIQKQVPANPPATDAGGPLQIWQTVFWCWAAIDPNDAKDTIRGGQTVSEVEIPIRIRYRRGAASNMRVSRPPFDDNGNPASAYLIKGIVNFRERNVWLDLTCIGLGASNQ